MRQAIVTRFLGPTNTKPARVRASCDAGRLTVSWDYSMGVPENHMAAARALCAKLGWESDLDGGSVPGAGYAFVQL